MAASIINICRISKRLVISKYIYLFKKNTFSFNKNIKIVLGDIIGKILAWISLAPLGIGSGFVALILFRRDLHTVGLILSFNTNTFLIFF